MCLNCLGPIDPVALSIGPLKIHWYGIFVAIGFFLAYSYATWNFKSKKINHEIASDLLMWGVIGGILGARITFIITFYENFQGDFVKMLKVWEGGLVFYGGFIGAALTLSTYCWLKNLPKRQIADTLAVALPLGHAFGRIGCWINGCCYGMKSEGFLSIKHFLPNGAVSDSYAPVQLWGTIGNLSLALFIFLLSKKIKRPGWLLPIYFICYGTSRWITELFRGDANDSPIQILNLTFTPAQVMSMFVIIPCGLIISFAMFIYYKKNSDKESYSTPNHKKDNQANDK